MLANWYGGSMIHVFMRNRVKTRRKAIKIKPAVEKGRERDRERYRVDAASRQQVCDELSRAESFLASERKDRAGTAVSSPGIKRVLSSRGVGCCDGVAPVHTGLRLFAIYHPFLSCDSRKRSTRKYIRESARVRFGRFERQKIRVFPKLTWFCWRLERRKSSENRFFFSFAKSPRNK